MPEPVRSLPAGRRSGATSADVARLAGVARSTVSHILNGQVTHFSDDTVRRVREASAQLGYVRSAAGRALVRGRSDLVVLAVPNTTLTNVQDIIEAISLDLDDLGLHVVVYFGRPDAPGRGQAALRHMVETLRPAGVVDLGSLSGDDLAAIDGLGCPVLYPQVLRGGDADDGNLRIARLQAEHLVARGRTRLAYAFIADRRDDVYGPGRAAFVERFCAEHGLPAPAGIDVPLDRGGARTAVQLLLARTGPGVGVICSTDEVAIAVSFAALRLGAAVPADVAVIGVGGADVGQLVTPRLTTVTFDIRVAVGSIREAVAAAWGTATEASIAYPVEAFSVLQGGTT